MMINMIYSSEPAKILNEKVCCNISSRLYFFCNMETPPVPVYSKDAIFMRAVNNLYKYTNDTTVVFNRMEEIFCGNKRNNDYNHSAMLFLKSKVNLGKFRDIKRTVEALRSLEAHNNSEKNGFVESHNIEECSQWISTVLGKKTVEDVTDYEKLISKLEIIGNELYEIADSFIDLVAESSIFEKEKIAKRWEDAIFSSYAVKENFFINQLGYFYYMKCGAQTVTPVNGRQSMKRELVKWVRNYFDYHATMIEQLRAIEARVLSIHGLSGSEKQEKLEKINQRKAEHLEKIMPEKTAAQNGSHIFSVEDNQPLPVLSSEDSYNFFRQEKLISLLKKELDDTNCNMLPDILIQNVIAREFSPIPLPAYR